MGGGWENKASPMRLVDSKAVGGEVVDDDGSDQWLLEQNLGSESIGEQLGSLQCGRLA
jgi:hypothetical protein